MRRYWLDSKFISPPFVNFENEVFHHIFDVCRQGVGNRFEVITPESKAYFVEVTEVAKKRATAIIKEERVIPPLPRPHIHLCVSVPKFSTLETIIEKSVELGVYELHPFFSDYSFVRNFKKGEWEHKKDRWNKIVLSATQQCGRGQLMPIHEPQNWEKIFERMNRSEHSMGLLLYEGDSQVDIKQYLQNQKSDFKSKGQSPSSLWVFIGSEGGFSTNEISMLSQRGFGPVTLGDQVLRVETACLAAVSVLKYEFDLMGEL